MSLDHQFSGELYMPEGADKLAFVADVSTTVQDLFDYVTSLLPSFSSSIFAIEYHTVDSSAF